MKVRASFAFILLIIVLRSASARADDVAPVSKGLSGDDWSSIRAAYEAGRHAAYADEAVPGHIVARNPGQQWRTRFDGRGFLTAPDAGGWSWGLDLVSYGRGEQQQTIDGTACTETKGTRVEYEWNHALTEWYINDQRGFEHGYTLRERPQGAIDPNGSEDGMLHFTLAVRGDLHPRVSENGRDVAFSTTEGVITTAVNYNNLKVFDADGVHLAASFQATTTAAGTPALRLTIDDTNARYPLTIDPTAQQAYLKAPVTPTNSFDNFGTSVAISGDTVVIGANREDSNATGVNGNQANDIGFQSGAAYVFVRTGSTWSQQAYLKASNTGIGDNFGWSVAISGDTVVVGADLEGSNATGVNGNQDDNSALGSGAAYVFVRSGTTWFQQAYLKASNSGALDNFGGFVAISGDTVVVGADNEDSDATGVNGNQFDNSAFDAGAAYVFVRTGTTWTQQAYLKASNTGIGDNFGWSVAISGDTVVVGAEQEDSNATGVNGNQADNSALDAGAAYVFVRPPAAPPGPSRPT
jgi:trimeric autotransporter adhesin